MACKICGRTQSLFSIELEDDGERWTSQVCGNCHDHISAIARNVATAHVAEIEQRIARLEIEINASLRSLSWMVSE